MVVKSKDKVKSSKIVENPVQDSFDVLKKINEQIELILKEKEVLKKDVSEIKAQKSDNSKDSSKLVLSVKEEILKDVYPLLNKLDLKSVKVDMFDEINKIISLEAKKLKVDLDSSNKKVQKDVTKKLSDLEVRVVEALNTSSVLRNELKKLEGNDLKKFYAEVDKKIKDAISNFNEVYYKQLNARNVEVDVIKKEIEKQKELLAENFAKYEQLNEAEKAFIRDKINEIIDEFNNFAGDNKFSAQIREYVIKFVNDSEMKISGLITTSNEFLSRVDAQVKQSQQDLKDDVETKFVIVKQQYETEFNANISKFDKELAERQRLFVDRLKMIEEQKSSMIDELESFKVEITNLTKEYVGKLDEEYQTLKGAHANFDSEKDAFYTQINEIVHVKKVEMQDYVGSIEANLQEILKSEKQRFESNENTFRQIFGEKVLSLKESLMKRVDSIEKRFVEKNLKYVKDELDTNMKALQLYEEKIDAKANEVNVKMDYLDDFQKTFFADIKAQEEDFKSRLEKRFTGLEQSFNRRFLDYDNNFANLKGVLIEEMEDLMKEANKKIVELSSVNGSLVENYDKFKGEQVVSHSELREIRDDIADVRVKVELMDSVHGHSMSDHIRYMSEYENNLLVLIKSLKDKGGSNETIKQALIRKGHPPVYVSMVLANFDMILN